nr:hypothetical protein [Hoylesella timonensis]
MMNEIQPVTEFAITLQKDLYNYLLSLNKVDAHLPDAPDIEEKWLQIANAYMPDAVREFNKYPTVVFGWMMYIGMAVAKYWDEDWELYNKVENLYLYLRNRIDFDHMDDYIREKVLCLNTEQAQTLQSVVGECAARTNNILQHFPITHGSEDAYRAVVTALHQLYSLEAAIQLKSMGYHMTKLE